MKANRPLRYRLLAAVSFVTLLTCGVFSLYTIAFTYAVEDAYLAARLEDEARQLRSTHAQIGTWVSPRDDRLVLHRSLGTLPDIVRSTLQAEPERVEFEAPGPSHYHLLTLEQGGDTAWLLYDAGRDLIVPPMRNKLLWLLGLTTALLSALALMVAYWAVRRATGKLEYLAAAVAELDPDRLIVAWGPASGEDEVGVLAERLGEMTTRLRAFIERERSFTRDASHELRTPLAVIRAAGEQIKQQPDLGQQSQQHAKLILESADRLENTVATLLALAREQHDSSTDNVRLLPLIEQVVLDQAPLLDGKRVEVVVNVETDATLKAPLAVARIIIANIVANAFCHTPAGVVRINTGSGVLRVTNPSSASTSSQQINEWAGRPTGDGYGFGLMIVRRLSDQFALRFKLTLEDDLVVATLPIGSQKIS